MTPLLQSLHQLFIRDLNKLESEVNLYSIDELLWIINGEIKNPAGNLCLHLCGNLQHYIGAVLGNSGYVRDREKEFSTRGISKDTLIIEIQSTKKALASTLPVLSNETLESIYPEKVFAEPMTTQYFLIHLLAHLSYHLGQINYHRRLTNNTIHL